MAHKNRDLTKICTKTGNRIWDFQIDGHRTTGSAGTPDKKVGEREARAAWQKARDEAGERRKATERLDMTWKEACDSYLLMKGSYASRETDLAHLQWLNNEIGEDRYVSKIDQKLLRDMVNKKRELHKRGLPNLPKLAPGTVNQSVVRMVSKILQHARLDCQAYLPNEPRYKRLVLKTRPRKKEMMITQEAKIRSMGRDDIWEVIEFILLSGLRLSAAILEWNQVHLPEGVIHVITKGDSFQEIPITDGIRRLLLRAKGKNDRWVWTWRAPRNMYNPRTGARYVSGNYYPINKKSLLTQFTNVCIKLNVEHLTVHDIRKTFGARMVRETGDLVATSELLNHSSTALTAMHYSHVTSKDKLRRMEQVAAASAERLREHYLEDQTAA